jgi:hypothetical protein
MVITGTEMKGGQTSGKGICISDLKDNSVLIFIVSNTPISIKTRMVINNSVIKLFSVLSTGLLAGQGLLRPPF